jgi:ABC-type multidrug transport system fused ATPase/permease subunit
MFYVSWKVTLVLLTGIVILGVVLFVLPRPKSTIIERDNVSKVVEDVFQNVDFITSTEYGLEQANSDMREVVDEFKHVRVTYMHRTATNQGVAYGIAIVTYVTSVLYLLNQYNHKKVTLKQFESSILTIGRMFDIIFGIAHFMPEFIGDVQTLHDLEDFTKRIFAYKDKVAEDVIIESGDIELRGVTFQYTDQPILENFSFKFESGGRYALFGPSGCGKSTFVKLVQDILQPVDGSIYIDGRDTKHMSKRCMRRYIGSISQNTSSLVQTTIYKNMIYGIKGEGLRKQVEDLIQTYDINRVFERIGYLDDHVDKAGSTLSGGQKQVVHLIHAILNDQAKVIILDEPTSAMDQITKDTVLDLIQHINDLGKTIIIITHDKSVRDKCETVLTFTKGSNPT